jgi:hypothetical protein
MCEVFILAPTGLLSDHAIAASGPTLPSDRSHATRAPQTALEAGRIDAICLEGGVA